MKLSDDKRAQFFELARTLSPELGGLFQNPMEISDKDIERELAEYYHLKQIEIRRWESYKWILGELLCFPDQVK